MPLNIFLVGTSFLPAYGGPAYSVSRLATALSETGVNVGLWAPDQSAAVTTLLPSVSRVQRLAGTAAEALAKFGAVDVLHDNGIWWTHNHRLAKLAMRYRIPRMVSTRGMLEPWAMDHKRWKKRLAWWLYQRQDLKCACCHHATAEAEAESVLRLGLGVSVRIIPNGVDLPEIGRSVTEKKYNKIESAEKKTAVFLGRIYPVKGLPMLIQAWAQVRPAGWVLQIAGPDEASHQAEVEKAVFSAGLDKCVSFLGPIVGGAKTSILSNSDLFVLPSHSESFGMAIAEALAHGLPVLTTTAAPWKMLKAYKCGWWVDPTVSGIANGLRQATSLDITTLRDMGARGRALVAEQFGWDYVAQQFIELYKQVNRY